MKILYICKVKLYKYILLSLIVVLHAACSNSSDCSDVSASNSDFDIETADIIEWMSSSEDIFQSSETNLSSRNDIFSISASSIIDDGKKQPSDAFSFSSAVALVSSSSNDLVLSSEMLFYNSSCSERSSVVSSSFESSSSSVEMISSSYLDNVVLIDSVVSSSSSVCYDLPFSSEEEDDYYLSNDSLRFRYVIENGTVRVSTRNGTNDLVIELGKMGIGNNLFDFKKFGKVERCEKFGFRDSVLFFARNYSDWIGPFQVAALNDKTGDDVGSGSGYDVDGFKITFTGGAHRYNNTTTGSSATARLAEVEFFVNGKALSDGEGYGDSLKIVWTNYVQAYNTKKADGSGREVLKENIYLLYDGKTWDFTTELIPLEDIVVRLWYGYQMTGVGGDMASHWIFVDGQNSTPDQMTSGNHDTRGILAYGGACNVEMWLDTSTGLGMRDFLKEGDLSSAFKSGTKLYFKIMNDESKILLFGTSYILKGTYVFSLI